MQITNDFDEYLSTLHIKGELGYNEKSEKYIILKNTPEDLKNELQELNKEWENFHLGNSYFEFE